MEPVHPGGGGGGADAGAWARVEVADTSRAEKDSAMARTHITDLDTTTPGKVTRPRMGVGRELQQAEKLLTLAEKPSTAHW